MPAIGPKQTSLVAPHVRFWPLADIASCTAHVRFRRQSRHDDLPKSALAVAIGCEADNACCDAYVCFYPKRTSAGTKTALPSTDTDCYYFMCVSLGGVSEAARLHQSYWPSVRMAARGAGAAVQPGEAHRRAHGACRERSRISRLLGRVSGRTPESRVDRRPQCPRRVSLGGAR